MIYIIIILCLIWIASPLFFKKEEPQQQVRITPEGIQMLIYLKHRKARRDEFKEAMLCALAEAEGKDVESFIEELEAYLEDLLNQK